jgi:hypothetical protein
MKHHFSIKTLCIVLFIALFVCIIYQGRQIDAFVDAGHCGVDLPRCSGERVRCMNGYCRSDIPQPLPILSDLPMTPPTKY